MKRKKQGQKPKGPTKRDPVIPASDPELNEHLSQVKSLLDLDFFVKNASEELLLALQRGLDFPRSPHGKPVSTLVTTIATVVSQSSPVEMVAKVDPSSTLAWQIIGRALGLKEKEPARMLAEMAATRSGDVAATVRGLLPTDAEKTAFTETLTKYQQAQGQPSTTSTPKSLPLTPPVTSSPLPITSSTQPPRNRHSLTVTKREKLVVLEQNPRDEQTAVTKLPAKTQPPTTSTPKSLLSTPPVTSSPLPITSSTQPPRNPHSLTVTKREKLVAPLGAPKQVTLPGNVTTFPALVKAVRTHSTMLSQALENPSSPNRALVHQWLKPIAKIVPDTPLQLLDQFPLSDKVMWQTIGSALNLKESQPARIPAELVATKQGTTPGVAAQISAKLGPSDQQAFTECLKGYRAKGLPLQVPQQLKTLTQPPSLLSSLKKTDQWLQDSQKAKDLLKQRHDQWSLATKNSKDAQAQTSAAEYAEQRAHDRLAWVLSMIGQNRICTSVLLRGRSIGVFANNPDPNMAADLEMLLSAARAEGAEARRRRALILQKWPKAKTTMKWKPSATALQRFDARLRKVIDYLRDLESTEGRMGAVAYNDPPHDTGNKVVQVHAEMQAFLLSKSHPGGKLGVSKQCCFKCWLVLILCSGDDVIEGRGYLSHGKTYPWPMPDGLASDDILAKVFEGVPGLADIIKTPNRKKALIQAITEWQLPSTSKFVPTDYASPMTQPPATPAAVSQQDIEMVLEDLPTDEQDDEAFEAMLRGDEQDEERDALQELIVSLKADDPDQQDQDVQQVIAMLSNDGDDN
ncbi:hypothetical protein [Nonomuraea angiospora]